jgi:hypothetical protein
VLIALIYGAVIVLWVFADSRVSQPCRAETLRPQPPQNDGVSLLPIFCFSCTRPAGWYRRE